MLPLDKPDYHDAEIILRLYELRREPVLREARDKINRQFSPKSFDDLLAISGAPDHPLNAAFRQTAAYWEMVYGMAKHGIVNPDYLLESNGEGIQLFAKVHPFLAQLREHTSPRAFQNAEWVTTNCDLGKQILNMMFARIR